MNRILPMTLIRAGGLPLQAWLPLSGGMPDWKTLFEVEAAAAGHLLLAFEEALARLPESSLRTAVYNARKDFFQRRKHPSGQVWTQIQSANELSNLQASLRAWQQTQDARLAAAEVFEEQLIHHFHQLQSLTLRYQETIARSLLFASHDLLDRIPVFAQKAAGTFDKKDRQTALSLIQYLTRAVFKTSPLGRLTTLEWCEWPALPPSDIDIQKSLVTPNVALLPALYEVLLREPAFFYSLSLVLNPSLSLIQEGQRREWLFFDGEREAFQEIAPDPVVDFVIKVLTGGRGEMPYPQLLGALLEQVDASEDQLQKLVFQLVDMGLLEWKLPELGMSPGWCGGLYQYLGFLPSSPVLTDAAYLLQWLRTTARVLPFQSIEDAQVMQREAQRELRSFFEKNGSELPPIPIEQLFFEDVVQGSGLRLPLVELENLLEQLAECWRQKALHVQDPMRSRLYDFTQKNIPDGETLDFLTFSKRFLATSASTNPERPQRPPFSGKLGALLQIFQENGTYRAVLNAMYPGGGKMFARWLPLFPTTVTTKIKVWNTPARETDIIQFPWQGWSNANFQPLLAGVSLAVPDARVGCLSGGRAIRLGDLSVGKNEEGWPQLIDNQTGSVVFFNDLGLEAPETRPPVMRLLWYLGVPLVSADSVLPDRQDWEALEGGVLFRRRAEYRYLVLSRGVWRVNADVCAGLFPKGKTRGEGIGFGIARMLAWGIPRRFFGRFEVQREKPQFYDMDSPISMVLLEKTLRAAGRPFLITEMLPMPEQWLGDRVGEFVVEFEV